MERKISKPSKGMDEPINLAELRSKVKEQFYSRPVVRVRSGKRRGQQVYFLQRPPNPVIRKVMTEGLQIKRRNRFWFKLLRPCMTKMSQPIKEIFGIYR